MKYYVEERSVASGAPLLTWTQAMKTKAEADSARERLLAESRKVNGAANRFDLGMCELVVCVERA